MTNRIGICGHFGGKETFLDGQTVKTKVIFQALCQEYGKDSILPVDTYGYKAHPLRLLRKLWNMANTCGDILILPAQNGTKALLPLFVLLKRKYGFRLHDVAIGGWLPKMLRTHDRLRRECAGLDTIFVETRRMAEELSRLRLDNACLLPNCKPLAIVSAQHQPSFEHPPYPLCTFSRVSREKGIMDAVQAVKRVNRELGKTAFTLTIYGQVDESYRQEFDALKKDFGHTVCYGGEIPYEQGSLVVGQYFALLFPTRCPTEGIPGTILDAYAGGTPVLGAEWENAREIIEENKTGWLYPLGNIPALESCLYELYQNPQTALAMRENCLAKAESYQADKVLSALFRRLSRK